MTATIVVGYDASDGAVLALETAASLAEQLGATLRLIFCYEPPAVLAGGPAGEQRDEIERIGRDRLNEGLARIAGRPLTAEGELVDARPDEGLIAAGNQYDALMIVVGHHGERPLRGALLGATANKLLHQAERPVLVVPAPD
jgi:nucleotide-binding universal stress UspA family protein